MRTGSLKFSRRSILTFNVDLGLGTLEKIRGKWLIKLLYCLQIEIPSSWAHNGSLSSQMLCCGLVAGFYLVFTHIVQTLWMLVRGWTSGGDDDTKGGRVHVLHPFLVIKGPWHALKGKENSGSSSSIPCTSSVWVWDITDLKHFVLHLW
jgi:hypothetical protein